MTKEDINKACKWLKKNILDSYVYSSDGERIPYIESVEQVTEQEFINRFRKAMEEQPMSEQDNKFHWVEFYLGVLVGEVITAITFGIFM